MIQGDLHLEGDLGSTTSVDMSYVRKDPDPFLDLDGIDPLSRWLMVLPPTPM